MTLSRCGRMYPTLFDAIKAAEVRTFKSMEFWKATSCEFGDHWHVVQPRSARGLDPFPPVVARQLDERDEHCQRCGRGGRLERHHRRAKHMGGSKGRAHTQCACNGLKLCRTCHRYVHEHVAESVDHGWIVLQAYKLPGKKGVSCCVGHNEDIGPILEPHWLRCDGAWVYSPLEVEG